MASIGQVATSRKKTRVSTILDIPKLLLGWPFATLWETCTLQRHYNQALNETEQERTERVFLACIGGIFAIAIMVLLAGWKIFLLLGKTAYPLPWWFAAPILVASIVIYVASFMAALNADDEEVDEEPRVPVRLYDLSKISDAILVVVILGVNAIAGYLYMLLGVMFWWVAFILERPRLHQSYGDYVDYRPDLWHAIGGGVSLGIAAGFLVAALNSLPEYWFGFGLALAGYILLSCWYHAKVKENPRWYGWD